MYNDKGRFLILKKNESIASYNKRRKRQVGEYEVELPVFPERNKQRHMLDNFDLPMGQQYWRRPEVPQDLEQWPLTKQKKYITSELSKIRDGYWFFNAGRIEYITGLHYFYLTYWRIKGGYPDFRYNDAEFFYLWDSVVNDDDYLGMIYIGPRRQGKTEKGACMSYHHAFRHEDTHCGIQSKTNDDAKSVFKTVTRSWRNLPFFLKPHDSGDSNPQRELRFEQANVRNIKDQSKKSYKRVLNSRIDYKPTVEEAYDGRELSRYYMDEFGKVTIANVFEMYGIVRECLMVGTRVVGKALLTTTVEEMERKGGANAKELWDKSGPDNKNTTKLKRLFQPGYIGLDGCINKFGYSLIDKAIKELNRKEKNMKGDELNANRRRYPRTIKDAFRLDGAECPFDVNKIQEQKSHNEDMPGNTLVRGDFVWEIPMEKVKWIPKENGKWLVYRLPEDNNRYVKHRGKMRPTNTHKYTSGVDPYDHNKTTDNRSSMAASFVYMMEDPTNKDESDMFVAQYHARPSTSEIFYEDMLKQCIFYGCQILVETNKIGLVNYFRESGFEYYLMKRPAVTQTRYSKKRQTEYGLPTTGTAVVNFLVNTLEIFVFEKIGYNEETNTFGKFYFDDALDELEMFDVNNRTPYDLVIAMGFTLIASMGRVKEEEETPDYYSIIPIYDNRGSRSRRIY